MQHEPDRDDNDWGSYRRWVEDSIKQLTAITKAQEERTNKLEDKINAGTTRTSIIWAGILVIPFIGGVLMFIIPHLSWK